MLNKSVSLGTFPIYCVLMLGVGLMNHVMVIPPLLNVASRDAWISVLLVIVPYMAWIAMLYAIMKRTGQQPILTWVGRRFGKLSSGAVRLFFIVYLFCIGALTLKETTNWTHGSYLPRTPNIVLSISLVLLCVLAARNGIRSISYVAGILLPFVIIFGDFVMSANLPRKDYVLLTPILERGWEPVFNGMAFIGGGLAELIILLLLQHHLKSKIKLWSIVLLGLFLIVLVLGPVTGAISEFGPFEAANLRYPAYEEWRLVKIGRYIQHVDFLSIYQWMSGAFIRISLSLLLLTELIAGGRSGVGTVIALLAVSAAMVTAAELPFSDIQYLQFMRIVYLPASLTASTFVLIVLFALTLIPRRARVKPNA